MNNRLSDLLEDTHKVKQCDQALKTLKFLEVDNILLDKSFLPVVNADNSNGVHIAAAAHYQQAGYRQCIEDLFLLLESNKEEEYAPVADFGAIDKMLKRKEITKEQAEKLMERE